MIHAFEFKCTTIVDFGVQYLSVNRIRSRLLHSFGNALFEAYSSILLSWLVALVLTK